MKTFWQHNYAFHVIPNAIGRLYLIQATNVLLIILFRIKFIKLSFKGSLIVLELEPKKMGIWLQWVDKT